ncbi:MAG: exopolysaccharide biosynthesis polyprenyl glycosylphosphotransferase [Hyphomicrobiaceae bacterium]
MSGVQRIGGIRRSVDVNGVPSGSGDRGKGRWVLGDLGFPLAVAMLTALAIVLVCVASGVAYHLYVYGNVGRYRSFLAIGVLVAFLDILPFVFRSELGADRYLAPRPRLGRLMLIWTWAFFALAVVAFLTKSTATFSRGWLLLFFVFGGATLVGLELGMRALARRALAVGRLARQRLMLIGTPDEIQRFNTAHGRMHSTVEVACVTAVPMAALSPTSVEDEALLEGLLERAVVSARAHEIDGIVLLSDWSHAGFVDACVAAFTLLPVSIHLDAGRLAERFSGIRIERVGPVAAFSLTEVPMGTLQSLGKRAFDILTAAVALVVLSGLFAVIAALIKWDSPGPVFFRQRRLGYNQREFRIFKFRSMSVQDDGDHVKQAIRNDPRVTRIGGILRRYNLDELPQLINVLKGEMSIVGPRPHAIAHDRLFEKRIEMYPRRLNVRPGITGWAQVHGLRGATDTDDKMAARVEHDLYYIDNWSLALDLYIVILTVVSPKAYRNAF